MTRRSRNLVFLASVSSFLAIFALSMVDTASGQDRAGSDRSGREEADVAVDSADDLTVEDETIDQDVESDVRREGGAKVKVYKFSGLGLQGRLKSPQMLFFLNRLRAEFDRPRLPHRSFIPELSRSTKGKAF